MSNFIYITASINKDNHCTYHNVILFSNKTFLCIRSPISKSQKKFKGWILNFCSPFFCIHTCSLPYVELAHITLLGNFMVKSKQLLKFYGTLRQAEIDYKAIISFNGSCYSYEISSKCFFLRFRFLILRFIM